MKVIRWILVPVTCILAWHLAVVLGLFLLRFAESFCPEEQMVSEMCTAPWWRTLEKGIFCFSTGMAAILVVAVGFFIAPGVRKLVVWIVFALGSIVALWMAVASATWAECVSAVGAGLLTSLLLARSSYAEPTTSR